MAAAARNGTGVLGIAFDATVLALRADTPGSCDETNDDGGPKCTFNDRNIAAAIDLAVYSGARVIKLSLGGSRPSTVLQQAAARAANAGVILIVSAGNDGDSTEDGIDPDNPDPFAAGLLTAGGRNHVIIVGSVDEDDSLSGFSNRAGSLATSYLSARGSRICCVYDNGELRITERDGQRFVTLFSGTSFAAPQVAGAVALLAQAFPNLTGAQIVEILLSSARDAGAAGADATYGVGILDIARAISPQGTTRVADTLAALPLTDPVSALSPAMGDARGGSLNTIVLDKYERAYEYDLARGMEGAQLRDRLGPALSSDTRRLSAAGGAMSVGFTIDARGRMDRIATPEELSLTREDAEAARVLAGRVALALTGSSRLGVAFGEGPHGMVAGLQGRERPAFLIADEGAGDAGLSLDTDAAVGLRQMFGDWGVTASAASGEVVTSRAQQLAGDIVARRERDGVSSFGLAADRAWGDVDASLGITWMQEDRTVLGARFHEALGAGGADSLFVDASAGWRFAPEWRIGAGWREGQTDARVAGLIGEGSRLRSRAWSLDLQREGVFGPLDRLGFRLSQPLRVESGGIAFDLPVAWDYASRSATYGLRQLELTPEGRELTGEMSWSGPLWGGSAAASVYYRRDSGHYEAQPDDKGLAFRWSRGF